MRTIATICISLFASGTLFVPSLAHPQDDTAGLDDVVLLEKSDISDHTILTFLKYRKLDFVLDAEVLVDAAGVSPAGLQHFSDDSLAHAELLQARNIFGT